MSVRRSGIGSLVAIGVAVCALMTSASPAHALAPWFICFGGVNADEHVANAMTLGPANGATVPAGTPVTFSGESNPYALTFDVASSPALLSSPDIDSGMGSQSGSFYRFTSTKATATPRTIYWTASFTLTPEDCERPYTFTTPVHTLVVTPSEAELAAVKRQQEEAAAKKKSEEETAAKKKEEETAAKKKEEETAAAGAVVLDGLTLEVQSSHEAAVKLTCSDIATCTGKLTLTAENRAGKGKEAKAKTETIGTATFSIPAGKTATVEVTLNGTGRALLSTDHGRLSAVLTIVRTAPLPSKTQAQRVHVEQSKAHGKTKR